MQEITCIACPVGCRLMVGEKDGEVQVLGNACKRGQVYGKQECISPQRMVTSLVALVNGKRPLIPVKTQKPVPKKDVEQVLAAIRQAKAVAPVHIGQVVLADVAGTGIDVIATREG